MFILSEFHQNIFLFDGMRRPMTTIGGTSIFYTKNAQGNLSAGDIMPNPSYRKLMRAVGPKLFLYTKKGIISPVDKIPRALFFYITKPTTNVTNYRLGTI